MRQTTNRLGEAVLARRPALRGRPGGPAEQALLSARELVRPALADALSALPGPVRRVASYHIGLPVEECDGAREPGGWDGGKGLRAALALAGARAVGAEASRGVPAAVAVELVHNFTLLHDDVMDGDRTRRHRPAAWVAFGVPTAVLAGDALLVLALRALTGAGCPGGVPLVVEALENLLHGQSQDMAAARRDQVTVEEYRDMAAAKTGALIGCACALGAVLGGASTSRARHLEEFGRHVGVAFQCADDLLGIWGDPGRTGKPVGADLLARKKTLPVIAALGGAGPEARRLAGFFASDGACAPDEVAEVADAIRRAGGHDRARAEIEHQIERALDRLDAAAPVAAAREELVALAGLAGWRDL
ncbi:polyprenyl synthetase family protein [Saccharopolyspora rosea]|uniref:Polyprenyl synthetase family protein n=1 Tax=Saccharopolyspora rosea TaxID=524884 RepID=A0ABW3FXT0_9PSEU|nr:polyprenyl synthetase family protein [Saccharopolyspora rosea]